MASHHITLHDTTSHYITLRHIATDITLQYVTLQQTLQCSTSHYNRHYIAVRHITMALQYISLRYIALTCIAIRYITLHYSTLHQTITLWYTLYTSSNGMQPKKIARQMLGFHKQQCGVVLFRENHAYAKCRCSLQTFPQSIWKWIFTWS